MKVSIRKRFEAAARAESRTLYPKVIKRYGRLVSDVFAKESTKTFSIYTMNGGRKNFALLTEDVGVMNDYDGVTFITVKFSVAPDGLVSPSKDDKKWFCFGIYWKEETSWTFKKSTKVWASDTEFYGDRWFYWDKPLEKRFASIAEKVITALKLRD